MGNYTGLNTRLKVVSKPVASIDDNYGPYDNVEDALNSIPLALRAVGLTVGIIEDGETIEYWFNKGIQDNNLVLKTTKVGQSFLQKDTMAEMKALSTFEINLLKNGTYRGVTLHGYYEKGDTPAPIDYYLSDTEVADDGGSVILLNDGLTKLSHIFNGEVDVHYFGAKGDGVTDDTQAFKKAIYCIESLAITPVRDTPLSPFRIEDFRPTLVATCDSGFLITDTLIINKSCHLDIDYLYFDGGDKICLQLNNFSHTNISVNAINKGRGNPKYYVCDWTKLNNTAVTLRNCTYNNFTFDKIIGFTRGIECLGDGYGFAWNKIYLNQIRGSLYSFIIKAVNRGWPNANIVYGGSFTGIAGGHAPIIDATTPRRAFIKVESDKTYGTNSWTFIGQNFEGKYSVNGVGTVVFYAPDYEVVYYKFIESRIESVTTDNTQDNPAFIISTEGSTRGIELESNQYCDNTYVSKTDGSEVGGNIFRTSTNYIPWKHLFDIGSNKNDAIYFDNRGYAYKGDIDIYNLTETRTHITTGNAWYGYASKIIKVYPGLKLRYRSNGNLKILPLKDNMTPFNSNNGETVMGDLSNMYLANLGINYPMWVYSNNNPLSYRTTENYITFPDNINYEYVAIYTANELEIYYDGRVSMPEIIHSRPDRYGYKDYYIIDRPLENYGFNTTFEKGMNLYNIITGIEYHITESGTLGVDATGKIGPGYKGTGLSGENKITITTSVATNFRIGMYIIIHGVSEEVYKVTSIDSINNIIYIDRNLTNSFTDQYILSKNPKYIRVNLPRIGTTDERPVLLNFEKGFQYYDTTLKKNFLWDGTTWQDLILQAEASADTATTPGETYNQFEVQSILTELRDLKTKMRDAGLLAT